MRKPKVRSAGSKSTSRKSGHATEASAAHSPQKKSDPMSDSVIAMQNGSSHANAAATIRPLTRASADELSEKVKELVRLAREQGYLTYNDINEALPDSVV